MIMMITAYMYIPMNEEPPFTQKGVTSFIEIKINDLKELNVACYKMKFINTASLKNNIKNNKWRVKAGERVIIEMPTVYESDQDFIQRQINIFKKQGNLHITNITFASETQIEFYPDSIEELFYTINGIEALFKWSLIVMNSCPIEQLINKKFHFGVKKPRKKKLIKSNEFIKM